MAGKDYSDRLKSAGSHSNRAAAACWSMDTPFAQARLMIFILAYPVVLTTLAASFDNSG